ncbi:uncharacterized protein DUF4236 [Sphingomonas sp. PP-F2F-A104-K0414]|uniref:DUF4236 domain-containing protein n=1 Tax=Sphingomonas sp. PP-F2F-A104-K0414 TaxID=2135661 RepID=UPI0010F1B459|nr:DUF4236 domain-containing protein [Sphingomonas sp. PP-F2F-A104-K0414]TCP96739.1 uncharacterized protein DUF4236 [Sphingomonas sp. PP-F2F-A104-K0414]
MPFYFRKSVSAGPFRFNLLSGEVGVSVGVRGLRFGTGPRGHYVHAGRGGLYYRSALGGDSQSRGRGHSTSTQATPPPRYRPPRQPREPNVEMVAVSSASVLGMTDERYGELLQELNSKQNAVSSLVVLGSVAGVVALFATIAAGINGAAAGAVVVAAALFVGSRLDAHRRSAVVLYDLEGDAAEAYETLTKAFDDLAASTMKWHVDSGGAVRDLHTWKRNAGATTILNKRPTEFCYGLPRVLKTNVTPPSMKVGKETLYWLPDVLLVVESGKVGAVAYDMLTVQWQDSRFIEEEAVPRDAQVVGQTWKHPNKNGGPDRRFANNRQLPICLYESIHLHSGNGLNELLQVSTNGRAQPLASAARRLASVLGAREQTAALPAL